MQCPSAKGISALVAEQTRVIVDIFAGLPMTTATSLLQLHNLPKNKDSRIP